MQVMQLLRRFPFLTLGVVTLALGVLRLHVSVGPVGEALIGVLLIPIALFRYVEVLLGVPQLLPGDLQIIAWLAMLLPYLALDYLIRPPRSAGASRAGA